MSGALTLAPPADTCWSRTCQADDVLTNWLPTYLARIGVTVFALLFAIALVTERPAAGHGLVVAASPTEASGANAPVFEMDGPVAVARSHAMPAVVVVPVALTVSAAVGSDGIIVASWYGPGFYGNRTACGQLYTPEIIGVAHSTLPCGTPLTLTYGGQALTVAVIDRGPFIAGRTIDLSNATKLALGCTDLCTLRMQVLR